MDAALAEAPPGSVREGGGGDLAAAEATLESDGFALLPTPLLTADGARWACGQVDGLVRRLAEGGSGRGASDLMAMHQRPGGEWLWALIRHPAVLAAARLD